MLARRIFADGRTRAYAWGRSVAREDVAALGERLLAMSGQFEQRRLARPAYQLDRARRVLRRRAAAPAAPRRASPGASSVAARRRHEELDARCRGRRGPARRAARARRGHGGLEPGEEDALREERERLRHADRARRGRGGRRGGARARGRRGRRGARRPRPNARWRRSSGSRRSSQKAADELRDAEHAAARGGERAAVVPRVARGRPGPARAGRGASSTGSPRLRRRFRCDSTTRSCWRARPRRGPSSKRSTRVPTRSRPPRRRSPRPRRAYAALAGGAARGARARPPSRSPRPSPRS